jgi:hypothetical protein
MLLPTAEIAAIRGVEEALDESRVRLISSTHPA